MTGANQEASYAQNLTQKKTSFQKRKEDYQHTHGEHISHPSIPGSTYHSCNGVA
jgi:hypothetical protein